MEPDVDPYAPTTPGAPPPGPGESGPGLAGRRLGDYEILREIGRGGMGVVYLARDAALDREVAVKVLHPRLAADPEFEKRFIREARTAAKLDHPGIVQVHSAGRARDVLYIAMQLVKGETLDARLRRAGRPPVREALDIVRQAALALQTAHEAGLIHRDIKPNNIMIDAAGRVKLMDFGLMRSRRDAEAISEPGVFYGTPEYASPEQCEVGEVDGRADLYSLGAVLYEMLAGRRPHAGETPLALFKKILEEPPVPLRTLNAEVPPAVAALVERMMAKRPQDRIGSAAELAAAVEAILAGGTPRTLRASRRPWLLAGAGALVALGAAALLFRGAAPEVAPPPTSGKLRLVVFDLKNGIPNPDTAWYSIALSDMLIAALAARPSLEVPARDLLLWKLKQMELSGKVADDDRRVLSGELGAGAYVSGSYYVQGGRIRLTLAGYRLPGSEPLFPALSFDGQEGNLFGLIDQAAAAVLRALPGGEGDSLALVTEKESDRALSAPAGGAPPAPPPAPHGGEEGEKAALRADAPTLQQGEQRKDAGPGAKAEKPQAAAQPQHRRETPASSEELTRAWYENRKALESGRLRKEDFEAFAGLLRQEFRRHGANALDKQAAEDAKAAPTRRLEFACPSCGSISAHLDRCAPCKRFRIVKLP